MLAAARDPALAEDLIVNRLEAVSALGISLTAAEEAILESAPEATLRELIRGLRGPDPKRRRFMQAVAAASAVAVVGCDEAEDGVTLMDAGGARPDVEELLDAGLEDAEVDASVDASVLDDAGMSWGSRPDTDGG